jgi:tetratricopeptide (TPR) repeat protein
MKNISKLVGALFFLTVITGCGNAEQSANKYLESGKSLVAKGELAKARLEFKNALQVDPRLAEAFYQLALLDEKDQKWQPMFKNLQTVESLNPQHIEAITKLGQVNLLAGNTEVAEAKAATVLELNSTYIPALLLKSSIEMNKQNYAEAVSLVDQALSIESTNSDALSLKALIFNKQGESDLALSVIEKALSSASKDKQLSLKMIKLSIFESQGDFQSMEGVYKELLNANPNEFWIVSALSKLNYQQQKFEEAIALLRTYISNNPQQEEAKSMLLSLLKDKKPGLLIEQLDQFIQQDTKNLDYQFQKIELLYNSNQQELAIDELHKVIEEQPDTEVSRKALIVLAGQDYNNGDFTEAELKINTILSQDSSHNEALLLQSKIFYDSERFNDVISNLRIVTRDNPESELAFVLLAQTYVQIGADDLAEDNYRRVLSINPSNTAAAFYVSERLINANNLDGAEKVLVEAVEQAENKEPLIRALTQIKLLKRDWEGAKLLLSTGDENSQNNVLWTHYISGVIALGQERQADAIDDFKQALIVEPSFERAFQGLVRSYLLLEQRVELKSYISDFIQNYPQYLFAYEAMTDVLVSEKKWQEAIELLNKGLSFEGSWLQGYSKLAAVYLAKNDRTKAIESYKEGIEKNENNLLLKLQLASVYDQSMEYDKAKVLYEEVLSISPAFEPAINNLASLLTDQFASKDNYEQAAELTIHFKDSSEPYYLDTYAWVQLKLGNYDVAKPVLERVVELAPQVAIFNYHLAEALYLTGNTDEAKPILNEAMRLANEQNDELTLEKIRFLQDKF